MRIHGAETILVTGGGGFLGGAIVQKLLKHGHRLRSFSRRRHSALDALGVEQIAGDIADPDAVKTAVEGVDAVVHTAARAGVWGPWEAYHRTNTEGTLNVIAACRAAGVNRLVYTSSPSVVFDGLDMEGVDESVPLARQFHAPYPASKALAETAVREAASDELRTICLRPHLIWGPGDNHLVPRILARGRRLVRVGNGMNRVDTVYIDNAADAHLLALHRLAETPSLSGRVYFVSNGQPIQLWKMVDGILSAGGMPPVRRSISTAAARRLGATMEWAYRTFRLPGEPPMTRFVAEELATSHWFDIGAARRDLGYDPAVSIDQGLRLLEEWLKSEGQRKETDPCC
ncbi:MAG: NAD-dependent epimerase/dehydratase family protein [Desulfobacterales bacterium]